MLKCPGIVETCDNSIWNMMEKLDKQNKNQRFSQWIYCYLLSKVHGDYICDQHIKVNSNTTEKCSPHFEI